MLKSRSSSLSGMSSTSLGAYLFDGLEVRFQLFCLCLYTRYHEPAAVSASSAISSINALLSGVSLLHVIWCRGNYAKQCRTLFVVMVTIYHPAVCVSTHTSLT